MTQNTLRVFALVLFAAPAAAQEPALTNSLGMTLVRLEPGSFSMGSSQGETIIPSDRWDEGPRHQVTITRPFYMATAEVTNAQFEQFNPEHRKHRGLRGVSQADDEAVTYVSWHDAVAFCEWLSEKEGKPYRLPTEAEWEYACRAGTTTRYWTGTELPEPHHRNQWTETDNRKVNTKDWVGRRLKGKVAVSLTAGAMPANPWGLHEMHGNVEEWVWDWYGPYPKKGTGPIRRDGPKGAAHELDLSPFSQTDPVGPAGGLFKVTRGGSHNSALKYLRSANRSATLPEDRHWLIGFRVVQAPLPASEPRPAVPYSMNDPTARPAAARWNKPAEGPVFQKPIPFVQPDREHPLLAELGHHHCPTITWCENGDLLAAWFNTISEIGREMVIVSSRLRYEEGNWADAWDTARLFFAPADRNTTGSCLLHDGQGRIYYLNAIGDSGGHSDQCLMLSTSEDSGRTWTRPRLISHPFRRHKYTPMDSAFVEDGGRTVVVGMDYAPQGFKANEAGSGVFISRDQGATWENRLTGKAAPQVTEGSTGGLAAGFHIGVARLDDGRLLAMTRTQGGWDIGGRMTRSHSNNEGETWTYRSTPFPELGSGQRLVLMRLREGPLLLLSFHAEGMFAALSSDEGETWPTRRQIDGNRHGYLAATQTPDNLIHLITSRHYYRMNLAWLEE